MFLGLNSIDDNESKALRTLLDSMHVEYPVLLAHRMVDRQYGVSAYPTTVIVDRNGRISYTDDGFVDEFTPAKWREAILKALKTP